MDVTYPTEAIILDRSYFREYDSRVIVYSKDRGKFDLVVRGTKRPKSKLAGHVEPFNLLDLMVVSGKQFDYVGSARARNTFSNLKENLTALAYAGKGMRAYKKLVEASEADAGLYELLRDFLEALNRKGLEEWAASLVYYLFVSKFISHLGYEPQMGACAKCGKADGDDFRFNYLAGGLLCGACAKGEKGNLLISEETVAFLSSASFASQAGYGDVGLSRELISELKKVLGMYVKYSLDFEI